MDFPVSPSKFQVELRASVVFRHLIRATALPTSLLSNRKYVESHAHRKHASSWDLNNNKTVRYLLNQAIKDVRPECLARKQRLKALGFIQETKKRSRRVEPTWWLPIMLSAVPLESNDPYDRISHDLNIKLYNSYTLCLGCSGDIVVI